MVGCKPGMNPVATIFSGIFMSQVVDLGSHNDFTAILICVNICY